MNCPSVVCSCMCCRSAVSCHSAAISANAIAGPVCSSDPINRKRATRSNIAGVGLRSRASTSASDTCDCDS
eukprot:2388420-Pyramimonas_sp.AAC.1